MCEEKSLLSIAPIHLVVQKSTSWLMQLGSDTWHLHQFAFQQSQNNATFKKTNEQSFVIGLLLPLTVSKASFDALLTSMNYAMLLKSMTRGFVGLLESSRECPRLEGMLPRAGSWILPGLGRALPSSAMEGHGECCVSVSSRIHAEESFYIQYHSFVRLLDNLAGTVLYISGFWYRTVQSLRSNASNIP
jgi:hypothetical protein